MLDQVQCPNCGGYLVYSYIPPQPQTQGCLYSLWENNLNFHTRVWTVFFNLVTGGQFNPFKSRMEKLKRKEKADLETSIFVCRICGYQFNRQEKIDPVRIKNNEGLLRAGTKKLQEDEAR